MIITAETRLSTVLDLGPQVLEYVIALDPHDFARLRNPLMRRLMPPRITLGRIAAMVRVPVHVLLADIAALGDAELAETDAPAAPLPRSPEARPAWVVAAADRGVAEVDLLPIDAALDADPMPPVMAAIRALAPGEAFRFRHKWEPQPFYDLWTKQGGLEWFAEQHGPDEWWVWVRRLPAAHAGVPGRIR